MSQRQKSIQTIQKTAILGLGAILIEISASVILGIKASSFALLAFALQSGGEGAGNVLLVWRWRADHHHREHLADKLLAISFICLAIMLILEGVSNTINGNYPQATGLGILLAMFSLIAMPILGIIQTRNGNKIQSQLTIAVGHQNYMCAAMAGSLLIGLAANYFFHLWWLDSIVAVMIISWAIYESQKAWRRGVFRGCC